MAEVVIESAGCNILQGQAGIRSDIRSAEADIRCDVRGAEADIRGDVRGAEANVRYGQKDAEANIRYGIKDSEADIRRDLAKDACDIMDATKTSGWKVADRVGTEADRIVAQDTAYYIAAAAQRSDMERSLAEHRAKTDANFERMVAVAQLQAAEIKANTILDGDRTRALINALNTDELNRKLIERNALIIEQRSKSECCHSQLSATLANAQNAQVLSAINAFQSQLNETRQSVNNFGTYLGAQTANPVNVR